MAIAVESNKDLPTCLNTAQKQARKAKQLASAHSGVRAKKARGPGVQGFFSRTIIVTLQTGEEVVIQFRPEAMDIRPFKTARQALGPVVPDIKELDDEDLARHGIWAYWMTCIPGQTWVHGVRGRGPEAIVTINRSLGRIFARGHVEGNSSDNDVVNRKLRLHLELLLCSEKSEVQPFKDIARELLGELDRLKRLPLFISHYDLNEVNIMVDKNCEVSGIIDWECSSVLPFGMGFGRIHTLAGEFSEGEFHMPERFEEAERAFWREVFDGVPVDIRECLDANLEVVQISVLLGTLLGTFELEEGSLGPCNSVCLKALPKFLSYRIPFLRGSDPPYTK